VAGWLLSNAFLSCDISGSIIDLKLKLCTLVQCGTMHPDSLLRLWRYGRGRWFLLYKSLIYLLTYTWMQAEIESGSVSVLYVCQFSCFQMCSLICGRFYCKGEGQGRECRPVDCSEGRQCCKHQDAVTSGISSHLKHQRQRIGDGHRSKTKTSVSGRPNAGQGIGTVGASKIPRACSCPDPNVLPSCMGPRLRTRSALYFEARTAKAASADFVRISFACQWPHVAVPTRLVSAFWLRETSSQYATACYGSGNGRSLATV